ncbi:MAG: hypothetical protein ACREST_02305 [Steroidobacteraceae bacterium]
MKSAQRWAAALLAGLLPVVAMANDDCNPVGTWSVDVTFPAESGIPPFTELLSFLPGGVVVETNSQLHPNSANQFLPFNGSPGYGAWARRPDCRVQFKVLKQVFDPTQQFLGFMRITVRARINGNRFAHGVAKSNVALVFGTDPDGPPALEFGGSSSTGKRVTPN